VFGKKRQAEKQAEQTARAEADLRAALVEMIELAEGGAGVQDDSPLIRNTAERIVYCSTDGGLFEPRRGPGRWAGRSAGFSIPLGESGVRFRVGKTAGRFVQGAESATIIDQGAVTITTQRVAFQGGKYTREWLFSKLVGVMQYSDQPWIAIQVSNRQKTSGISCGHVAPDVVRLKLAVAVAIFHGESVEAAKELRQELAELDAGGTSSPAGVDRVDGLESPIQGQQHPGEGTEPHESAPAGPCTEADIKETAGDTSASHDSMELSAEPDATAVAAKAPPPVLPPPTWAADPSGRHQLRYWDGRAWTESVSDGGQPSTDPMVAGHANESTGGDRS
jgi:hypothetical protein